MYELQKRSQLQHETTSKLEAKMRLPDFHALARIALVLAGNFEELARRIEEAPPPEATIRPVTQHMTTSNLLGRCSLLGMRPAITD